VDAARSDAGRLWDRLQQREAGNVAEMLRAIPGVGQ
jgi:hypothetical protein